jgi:hypothetical protein
MLHSYNIARVPKRICLTLPPELSSLQVIAVGFEMASLLGLDDASQSTSSVVSGGGSDERVCNVAVIAGDRQGAGAGALAGGAEW